MNKYDSKIQEEVTVSDRDYFDALSRIFFLQKNMKMNDNQFSKFLGINRSNLSRWKTMEGEKRKLSLKTLERVANACNVSIDWLQTGKEPESKEKQDISSQLCSIPCYEIAAGAGETFAPSYEEMTDLKTINYPVADIERHNTKGSNCFCMLVKGNSMEPTLNDGDKIIVDKVADNNIIDGQIYVFNYGDYVRVKRLSKIIDGILISSDNPKYATEKVVGEQDGMKFNVIGRVIERMGRVD